MDLENTKSTLTLTRDSPNRSWGFRFYHLDEYSHGPYIIQRIFAGSPAERSLKSGDKITRINGRQLESLTYRDVMELLKLPNESISLELYRSASTITAFDTNAPVEMRVHCDHKQPFVHPIKYNTISSDFRDVSQDTYGLTQNTTNENYDPIFRSSVTERSRIFTKPNQNSYVYTQNANRFRPLSTGAIKSFHKSSIEPKFDFGWAPSEDKIRQVSNSKTHSISTAAAFSNASYEEYLASTFPSNRTSTNPISKPAQPWSQVAKRPEAPRTQTYSTSSYGSHLQPQPSHSQQCSRSLPRRPVSHSYDYSSQQQPHIYKAATPLRSFTIQRTLTNVALPQQPRSRSVSQRMASEQPDVQPQHYVRSYQTAPWLGAGAGDRGANLKINVYDSENEMRSFSLNPRHAASQYEDRSHFDKYLVNKKDHSTSAASPYDYGMTDENLVDEDLNRESNANVRRLDSHQNYDHHHHHHHQDHHHHQHHNHHHSLNQHQMGVSVNRPLQQHQQNNFGNESYNDKYDSITPNHAASVQHSSQGGFAPPVASRMRSEHSGSRTNSGAKMQQSHGGKQRHRMWDQGVNMHLANPVNVSDTHY